VAAARKGEASHLLEDPHLAFFQLVYAVHAKARIQAGGYHDRYFVIGDETVRLRFAGPGLEGALTPALAHVETPPTDDLGLTVLLWDSASTDSELPLLLSRYFDCLGEWWIHLGRRGEIKEWTNERFHAAFHLGPNIFSIIDLQQGLALYWVKDARALPYYEIGSPLRTILSWWTAGTPFQFVHAGAVGVRVGGALLAGKGGAGKSTIALACLQAGMLYASDDYCLIKAGPQPAVYSVYNTAKLRGEADLLRFPLLGPLVSNKTRLEEDKALLFVHQHFPGQVCRAVPLRAILLPRITQKDETHLAPASHGAALEALAPTTLMQLPGAGDSALKTISRLARQVPAFYLDVGTNMAAIPVAIEQLLSHE